MDKKLRDGVLEFKNNFFEENKDLFDDLSKAQNPHTLYIGCSDSRIVPDIITHTLPGELFVIRNIGNMVPPYDKNDYAFRCTAAVIEYAVNMLEVKNIVICGHNNCGGCKALYYPEEKINKLPLVKKWLTLGEEVKEIILKKDLNSKNREIQTEQLNVIKQLENLLSYPFIKEKVEQSKIELHGWYYIIETADVFNYNFDNKKFELITKE